MLGPWPHSSPRPWLRPPPPPCRGGASPIWNHVVDILVQINFCIQVSSLLILPERLSVPPSCEVHPCQIQANLATSSPSSPPLIFFTTHSSINALNNVFPHFRLLFPPLKLLFPRHISLDLESWIVLYLSFILFSDKLTWFFAWAPV